MTDSQINNRVENLKRIPIRAAKEIAEKYGYDQVMIYARKCDDSPLPHGEQMTTYGVNKAHCHAMARIASFLQKVIMKWETE